MIIPYEPATLQKHAAATRRAATDTVALIKLGHLLGLLTVAGGCAAIAAYALDFEAIWRPVPAGPALHPITAILLIVGGLAVASMRAVRTPGAATAAFLVVALVGLVRILEVASGLSILQLASLFPSTLAREASEGMPISIGWNTAAMFLLVSLSFLLLRKYPRTSQIVAAAGMAPPLISLTGYIYGIAEFHGQMSLTTAILGTLYSTAPLLISARTGIMRAICSPGDGGRFGRLEIGVITFVLFVGGFVVQRLDLTVGVQLMPVFVVFAILTASTTIAFCTIVIERNDYRRRQAERTISQLVLRDPLSGLYNRRFLKEQQTGLIDFAKRKGYQVSALMVDIDHFKAVNDTHGHLVGDQVIRRVADVIKERLRSADLAIRYGGEELLVILLDADLEAAAQVGEELRSRIEAADFSDLGFPSLTVSIGIARVLTSLTEAIGRADDALYDAKALGRNRVARDETSPRPKLVATNAKQRIRA